MSFTDFMKLPQSYYESFESAQKYYSYAQQAYSYVEQFYSNATVENIRYLAFFISFMGLLIVIALIGYFFISDPLAPWESVRPVLVQLKDQVYSSTLDSTVVAGPATGKNFLTVLDESIITSLKHFWDNLTFTNLKKVSYDALIVFDKLLEIGLRISDFVFKHWI